MRQTLLFSILFFLFFGCSSKKGKKYIPDSNGNINTVTVVMSKQNWNGNLGKVVREELAAEYKGLPLVEPTFSLKQLNPKAFNGFARNSRNIVVFEKDSLPRFNLYQDLYARPQVVAYVRGEDEEIQAEYVKENAKLLIGTFQENDRKEKLRRIGKSVSKGKALFNRFKVDLTYPTAYKTVKDTTNFIWIEKPISKGTMNIIVYTIPFRPIKKSILDFVVKMRDSIGKLYIPGSYPNSYMITEEEYQPILYKTKIEDKKAFLTKGMWEVEKAFIAGPFVNYMVEDKANNRWLVAEGFAFAPNANKRDYMFELNAILTSLSFSKKK